MLLAAPARAGTEECARVLERARDLRAANKLKDAIAEMNACSACPALADVCDQTRASMQSALPTHGVRARSCDGETLDATITIDGDVVGSVTSVDPGRHDVRAAIGRHVEEQTVFVAEGEHKSVSLVVGDAPRPTPPGVWALAGTAAGALVTATTLFGIAASLPDRTSPFSPALRDGPLVVDETKHDFAVAASVALGASITVLVTAIVVYVTRPFPHPKAPD
jgi:hypothetical protein